jgi:hypothetical protein
MTFPNQLCYGLPEVVKTALPNGVACSVTSLAINLGSARTRAGMRGVGLHFAIWYGSFSLSKEWSVGARGALELMGWLHIASVKGRLPGKRKTDADQVPRCWHGCVVDRRSTFGLEVLTLKGMQTASDSGANDVGVCCRNGCRDWATKATVMV